MKTLFFSYSHVDEIFREQLGIHMAMLIREGAIRAIHDRCIRPGEDLDRRIEALMQSVDLYVPLVSPDFLNSDYCFTVELERAIERHERGLARVIPVIVRPCDWHSAPFGRLLASPRDGKAITLWPNRDEALLDVTQAIRSVLPRSLRHRPPARGACDASGRHDLTSKHAGTRRGADHSQRPQLRSKRRKLI